MKPSHTTFLPAIFFVLSPIGSAQIHDETDGLVVMEVENTPSTLGEWQKKSSLSGFTGAGYLEFTGNDYMLGEPKSPLLYHFKINRGGTYVIDLKCAKTKVQGHQDWANDCYIRVIGDFTSLPGPHDIPGNHASLNMLKTDMKYFGGKIDGWEWASGDMRATGGRLDPGGKNNKRKAVYHFKAGQTYTLVMSGRSKLFRADRIVFRHSSVSPKSSQDPKLPVSPTIEGEIPKPDDMNRKIRAHTFSAESHPDDGSIIQSKRGEAVGPIQNGSWIRFDKLDFGVEGVAGTVEIEASCAGEGGQIELRTGAATGPLLGTVEIRKTWDLESFTDFSGNLTPVTGENNLYLVFKGGAGDLFHVRSILIRSGETVQEKQKTPPLRPPAGRLAIVADGNSPDPDDIGATAAALAMLRAAGLDKRLVHCSHSCDLVKARNIRDADELKRQQMMQTACDGTVERWGGFDGLTFWNCRTRQREAVDDLKTAINASSGEDPLWIIEAGEPDIIGYALEAADAPKRKHVKLITHHPVNDGSGDYFKWPRIEKLGIEVVRVPDQNGANYAALGTGLQRPLWAFHWARDHEHKRIKWLWEQVKIAEQDKVVGFQKNKCDISDAGMILYWITGANTHGGYRTPDMDDVKRLFETRLKTKSEP